MATRGLPEGQKGYPCLSSPPSESRGCPGVVPPAVAPSRLAFGSRFGLAAAPGLSRPSPIPLGLQLGSRWSRGCPACRGVAPFGLGLAVPLVARPSADRRAVRAIGRATRCRSSCRAWCWSCAPVMFVVPCVPLLTRPVLVPGVPLVVNPGAVRRRPGAVRRAVRAVGHAPQCRWSCCACRWSCALPWSRSSRRARGPRRARRPRVRRIDRYLDRPISHGRLNPPQVDGLVWLDRWRT